MFSRATSAYAEQHQSGRSDVEKHEAGSVGEKPISLRRRGERNSKNRSLPKHRLDLEERASLPAHARECFVAGRDGSSESKNSRFSEEFLY